MKLILQLVALTIVLALLGLVPVLRAPALTSAFVAFCGVVLLICFEIYEKRRG